MRYTKEELIKDWEYYWGKLDEKWVPIFLNDKSISSILKFDQKLVQIAISKNKKLSSIAEYLERTSFPEVKRTKDSKIESFDKPGSMQQAVKISRINNRLDPKIPDNDWWRDQT